MDLGASRRDPAGCRGDRAPRDPELLRPLPGGVGVDPAKMTAGVRLFLEGLGERFSGDDLDATPARVARAWAEDLVSGYTEDPASVVTWTEAPPGAGLVIARDIRFSSICVHHLLPFSGVAHLAYLPGRRLAGLSKLGRVLDVHARRL